MNEESTSFKWQTPYDEYTVEITADTKEDAERAAAALREYYESLPPEFHDEMMRQAIEVAAEKCLTGKPVTARKIGEGQFYISPRKDEESHNPIEYDIVMNEFRDILSLPKEVARKILLGKPLLKASRLTRLRHWWARCILRRPMA